MQLTEPLDAFLDQVRDLAHAGGISDMVVLTVLKNALSPEYAAILASKTADATALGKQLTLTYVY